MHSNFFSRMNHDYLCLSYHSKGRRQKNFQGGEPTEKKIEK